MEKLLTLLTFFVINIARADFVPIDFVSMTNKADIIAYGDVICVDENVYELRVDKSFQQTAKVITVNKFKDWTCAIRWSEYFVGQEMMVFLVKNENGLFPVGAGNEGELPIFEKNVYPSSMSWSFEYGELKKLRPLAENKKYDSELYFGIELKLVFLWSYVGILKECFKYEQDNSSRVKWAMWICSPAKAQKLKRSNKLYAQTFERLIPDSEKDYSK